MTKIENIVNTIFEVSLLRRAKKKSSGKKIVMTTIVLLIIWLLGFYIYVTYNNIEIYDSNYTAEKTQSTIGEQTVEKVEEESKNVADVIEETVESVVGISKLKNAGTSIFTNSTESQYWNHSIQLSHYNCFHFLMSHNIYYIYSLLHVHYKKYIHFL